MTNVVYPGNSSVTNRYNLLGQLARVKDIWLKNNAHTVLARHSYNYNAGGQRTKHTRNDGLSDKSYVDYTYDEIGQLRTATGKEASGTTRSHEIFRYGYDKAGNLSSRTNNVLKHTFNANNNNHLTSITRSGTLTVAGTSSAAATSVTVNGSAASRYADATFARTGLSLVNGNNTFTAIASDSLGRSDTNAITVYMPSTVSFTYDDNGNMTSDGVRTFDYDDENQLISVYDAGAWKAEFVYDGKMRRRIRKEYEWIGSAWVKTHEVLYVYDGNLVLQERDWNNTPTVTYTRGSDLSGSREGAGGIGGLLARSAYGQDAFYLADGNGNITHLANNQQALVAKYQYDPYGNLLSSSGPLAEANLYRFSSKEFHPASGLVYYLYRYYEPSYQRWLNRDPIQELGGINLHGFVLNNPVGEIDLFGQLPGMRLIKIGWEMLKRGACASRIFYQVKKEFCSPGKIPDNEEGTNYDGKCSEAHCIASCRITRECGPGGDILARAGGLFKEMYLKNGNKRGWNEDDSWGDLAANEYGIYYGKCPGTKDPKKDCESRCKGLRACLKRFICVPHGPAEASAATYEYK